jgi:hypothetical protein
LTDRTPEKWQQNTRTGTNVKNRLTLSYAEPLHHLGKLLHTAILGEHLLPIRRMRIKK